MVYVWNVAVLTIPSVSGVLAILFTMAFLQNVYEYEIEGMSIVMISN